MKIYLVLRTGGTCYPYQLFAFCGPGVLEDGCGRTVSCESCNSCACMKRFVPPASYSGSPGSNSVSSWTILLGGLVLRFLVQMVLYCKLGDDNGHIFSISVSYILYKLLNESQLCTFCGHRMTTEVHISFLT